MSIIVDLKILMHTSSQRALQVVHKIVSATYKNNVSKRKLKAAEPNPPKLGNVRTEVSLCDLKLVLLCTLIMVQPALTEPGLGNFCLVQNGVYLLNS